MNDLANQTAPATPVISKENATYTSLFEDDQAQRCATDAPLANTGPLAYLIDLKARIDAFERRAEISEANRLAQRRPDLLRMPLDDKNLKKTVPAQRLVIELLEDRVRQARPADTSLQETLANATYPLDLPFHYAWESIKTTLEKKRLSIWDVVRTADDEYPNFTFDNITSPALRAATTLSSGLSPELRSLLVAKRAGDAAFYRAHFHLEDSKPLETLGTTKGLCKALGVTRRELRQLLAVRAIGKDETSVVLSDYVRTAGIKPASSGVHGAVFINNGFTPLHLSRPDPAGKTVRIDGLSGARLDRLQRMLRLQWALQLNAAETDTLVMAALRAEARGVADVVVVTEAPALEEKKGDKEKDGQKAEPTTAQPTEAAPKKVNDLLTSDTLRALGMFRHLQQKYAVKPYQYAAFLDEISPYGIGRSGSFYDKLFNPSDIAERDDSEPVLTLDDSEFDPNARDGEDALTLKQLCVALKADEALLRTVLAWVVDAQQLEKPTRSLAVVSACYRMIALPRLFGLSATDGMLVLSVLMGEREAYKTQLAGIPTIAAAGEADIVDVLAGVMNTIEWLKRQKLGVDQVFLLLNPLPSVVHPSWAEAITAQEDADEDEEDAESCCRAILHKGLGLDHDSFALPLLRWAGQDVASFHTSLKAIRERGAKDANKPATGFTASDIQCWATLERYAAVVSVLGIDATTLDELVSNPGWFNLEGQEDGTIRPLDLTTLHQLSRYKAILAMLPDSTKEIDLLAYLREMNGAGKAQIKTDDAWDKLIALLGLPAESLANIASLQPPATVRDVERLLRQLDLANRSDLSVDALIEMGTLKDSQDYAAFQRCAVALRKGCTASDRKVLDGELGGVWREALLQWLVAHWVPGNQALVGIENRQDLADYLLTDVQVSHQPVTTRVASAITSLQRYLHQLHARLEPGYQYVGVPTQERDDWVSFASRYETWRTRQELQNEPQNFIDPTRRLRRTEAFKELENLLAQGKRQAEDIQTAMLGYLSSFEKVSNIQPISVYADGTLPLADTYHFIGKTNVEPVEYYWRTLDLSLRDQDNAPSMLAWGEWQKISLSINGGIVTTHLPEAGEDTRPRIELIRPVIIAGRRYVVWIERDSTAIAMGSDNKASAYFPLRVCFAFQQTDGSWSPPNELLCLDGHDASGKFMGDRTKVPEADDSGTAKDNAYLKTVNFEPGLTVMVNSTGDRFNDPWLTVLLFDAAESNFTGDKKKTEWKRNQDYFIVVRDLLLLEEKQLDAKDTTTRPIETRLVTNWLAFFRDPRVVQHPYVGALIELKAEAATSKAFAWAAEAADAKLTAVYDVKNKGSAVFTGALSSDQQAIEIAIDLDSDWVARQDVLHFKPITVEVNGPLFQLDIEANAGAVDADAMTLTLVITSKSDFLKNIYNVVISAHAEGGDDQWLSLHGDALFSANIPLGGDGPSWKTEISVPKAAMNARLMLDITSVTRMGSGYGGSDYYSSAPLVATPRFEAGEAHLKAVLTAELKAAENATWTLSGEDRSLLKRLKLDTLETWAKENADAFTTLKKTLLTTRYTTQWIYNEKIGLPPETGTDDRLSVAAAIDDARDLNRKDVVDFFIAEEAAAVTAGQITLGEKITEEAVVRLRHLHPEACMRILLCLDAKHEMAWEDLLITDGKRRMACLCPVSGDITLYTFSLTLSDPQNLDGKTLATLTRAYKVVDKPDDAVPSVQIRRNGQQALYLDLKEANQKAGKKGKLAVQSLRLNTLFGKQLVALATRSVDMALSWHAQSLPEPPMEAGSEGGTVDFRGANGLYFWELFFHVPFLVAWRLRETRQYHEAWHWCTRYLFDPYRTANDDVTGQPAFWLSQPLLDRGAFKPTTAVNDPDLLAYARPECYRQALHRFVVDGWRREGDDLYRQFTPGSLAEAGMCYEKALRLIGVLPELFSTTPGEPVTLRTATAANLSAPLNTSLVQLRNLLRNRLHNLRHGLTLDGKQVPLSLYGEDEAQDGFGHGGFLLGNATGQKLPLPIPPYRYREVRARADAAVAQLIGLGRELMHVYEREADESLNVACKANLIMLSEFACRLQTEAVESARRGKDTLLASKQLTQHRLAHYQGLLDEGILDLEHSASAMGHTSQALLAMAVPFEHAAGITDTIPTIFGMAFGGSKASAPMAQTALGLRAAAQIAEMVKEELRSQAEYELRGIGWQFEVDQAKLELTLLDKQLLEQEVQIRATQIALEEARAQQRVQREEHDLMVSGFAIVPTYTWMIGQLSEIYAAAYDAVLSLCLTAQASLQYELGDFTRRFVRTGAWRDNWRGMLAGESLQRDLLEMDTKMVFANERGLHIRKDFSLVGGKGLSTAELEKALTAGKIPFELSAADFDRDFPGHFLRRIVSLSVTLKLKGSSTAQPLAAMLTQTGNTLLLTANEAGVKHLYGAEGGDASELMLDLRTNQQIAVWSTGEPVRDLIVYRALFDEGRYLPFEGTGAISRWVLSFPGDASADPVLKKDGKWQVEDIIVHLDYTAIDGGDTFREQVRNQLSKT
ncbi:Tc toxin subunit A [Pseudomonas japonica]|uniref:Tc toxin subunit A-related protein n=1 Tax=Pseudomonas japonica TaxID=256466 RepID=UPI0037F61F11